jgi:CheY-like chemotaxis protein
MSKKGILIVDDDVVITRNLKLGLEATGAYHVRAVNDPLKVMAVAREYQPDLVVLDVMMPGLDGGEIKLLLQNDPVTKNIPVIFLTAMITKNEAIARKPKNAQAIYLAKPVDLADLMACITEILGPPEIPSPGDASQSSWVT